MNDSEFDQQMKGAFLITSDGPYLWPRIKDKLPRPRFLQDLVASLAAAALTLLVLYSLTTGNYRLGREPQPVATLVLQSNSAPQTTPQSP